MTITDLLEYYESNKNECNEIRLVQKITDKTFVFRHYLEYGTCVDRWLDCKNGYIYKSSWIVEDFDLIITPKEFKDLDHVKKIIKNNYEKTASITLFNSCVDKDKDILFSIYERQGIYFDEYYLLSHFNYHIYTLDDILRFGYKYYEGV